MQEQYKFLYRAVREHLRQKLADNVTETLVQEDSPRHYVSAPTHTCYVMITIYLIH